ncbi:hypothetical protein FIV42_15245 [Persicimonas caeni]|uniref:Uncharacterized protein n=1 Tax=Persicimonas caeni TaxID=2292766 RepID=A0A4Y6PVN4_PERCE|nr:hypothetical protein [Persicimonas caeni]QDG52047.1 hypothetical protein FIV42_15245 [Persicimonas caeni]QED33268.1 hypothetical protein FRD00_15240 [Persicimonas caeni]
MTDHKRWENTRDAWVWAENDDLPGRDDKRADFLSFKPEEWMGDAFDQIEAAVISISSRVDRHGDTLSCWTDRGENLSVRIWQAPFPSPPGIEARIAWSVDEDGRCESGETDVQPDDPFSRIREHVMEEIASGLARLRDR